MAFDPLEGMKKILFRKAISLLKWLILHKKMKPTINKEYIICTLCRTINLLVLKLRYWVALVRKMKESNIQTIKI